MRAYSIRCTGDAADVPKLPPPLSEQVIKEVLDAKSKKQLAREENEIEPSERGLSHKYRRKKLHELNSDDLVGIVYARLIEERQRRDIAEEFRVSVGLVSRLTCKCKVGLEFLVERQEKESAKEQQVTAVCQAVNSILS